MLGRARWRTGQGRVEEDGGKCWQCAGSQSADGRHAAANLNEQGNGATGRQNSVEQQRGSSRIDSRIERGEAKPSSGRGREVRRNDRPTTQKTDKHTETHAHTQLNQRGRRGLHAQLKVSIASTVVYAISWASHLQSGT